jgi:alkylation response protein AidB-like acyl-CoA dehydrogenase
MTTLDGTTAATTSAELELDDALLERCRRRAGTHDAENTFFHDDFAELTDVGYLLAAIPRELGGYGAGLQRVGALQRTLARHAPPTALALSMHLYWTGMAADLWRAGDRSCEWILTDAVDGHVFAAGHGEAGNDLPIILSTASAERTDGGYRFTGHKQFGSLSPVWTRLGVHAMDTSDPTAPTVVHGFVARDDPGHQIVETWDTLGMRATQSHDTVLDGCEVPDERIARVLPAGDPSDPFVGTMQVWALTLFSNVYTGIAERALELAVASAARRTSIAVERGSLAHHPGVQHRLSEMYLRLDGLRAVVDRLAADWLDGAGADPLFAARVMAAKWRAAEEAKTVVDIALDLGGGGAMFRGNELERLYRDVRCGGFHPGNHVYVHEMVGKLLLGVEAETPRW